MDDNMIPVLTDCAPAPLSILAVIKCKCSTGCNTMRCSCRKRGLDCSLSCVECRGLCGNILATVSSDSGSDEDKIVKMLKLILTSKVIMFFCVAMLNFLMSNETYLVNQPEKRH